MMHVISLGAGVQSSTMALMAKHGEIGPMPEAAIFADTQAEPKSVYEWLDWLEKELPFPLYRVTAGSLEEASLSMHRTADGRLYSRTNIPFFTLNHDGSTGKIVFRGCTRDFKLVPLHKKQRALGGIKRGQKMLGVVSWIGISLDEVSRVKDSRFPWLKHRYPLIENRITRWDCLRWMQAHGYPEPPRSACVFCPFHNNHEWRRLRNREPEGFQRAIDFERRLQEAKAASQNFRTVPFLHRSLAPLALVDLRTDEEKGQLNFFENECEGMCGV